MQYDVVIIHNVIDKIYNGYCYIFCLVKLHKKKFLYIMRYAIDIIYFFKLCDMTLAYMYIYINS